MKLKLSLLIVVTGLVLAASVALAQSGRVKRTEPPKTSEALQPSPSPVEEPKSPRMVDGERIYSNRELDKKTVIKKKPEPSYTEEARRRDIQGTVTLRAVLSGDGTVKHIEVVKGLPYGLNERAIEAARKVKFEPGMKDGKPASIQVVLIYRFLLS